MQCAQQYGSWNKDPQIRGALLNEFSDGWQEAIL